MRRQLLTLASGIIIILAAATPIHAQLTLFEENFESGNLDQWTGQFGGPHSGHIVPDPLNGANQVLSFTAVDSSGDIFGATPVSLIGVPQRFSLVFDFLGLSIGGIPPAANGGFAGIAVVPGFTFPHYWGAGTYLPALNVPPSAATLLVPDGQWHHYEVDFTEVVTANNLTSIHPMLEDFSGLGSMPGDVYFDNVQLVAIPEPGTLSLLALGLAAAVIGIVTRKRNRQKQNR
jgi:hypothetical protein